MHVGTGPDLRRLQADIDKLERGHIIARRSSPPLRTGAVDVDTTLPGGGLSRHGLHEVLAPPSSSVPHSMMAAGAASGFVAGLLGRLMAERQKPVLWCRRNHDLYAPGLQRYGVSPERVLLAHPKNDTDMLWAMEEGLRSGAVAAVIGEADNPSHTAFRRLQLAAERNGIPGFLLRAGTAERAAGPVTTRWFVASAPSRPCSLDATWPGRPRFDVRLLRARGVPPRQWIMEWQYDDTQSSSGCFAVVTGVDDCPTVAVADHGARRLSA